MYMYRRLKKNGYCKSFITEQVMEYHLQAIDDLSIPNDTDSNEGDHIDATRPVTSKCHLSAPPPPLTCNRCSL